MRFEDAIRKAASLVIEMPPEEPKADKPWNVMDAALPDVPSPTGPVQAAPSPRPAAASATAPSTKTVEQVVRDAPGPNLDQIKPVANPASPVMDDDGNVNFGSIYSLAQLPNTPFTAEQVLELLSTLPAELPIEAKRSTVNITVSAMAKATGVSTESIVADASRKLAALAAYAKSFADQAASYTTKAEAEIAAFLAEIEQRKKMIENAKAKQAIMIDACSKETERLDEVLEFFSLDIHPSKYAPPTQ